MYNQETPLGLKPNKLLFIIVKEGMQVREIEESGHETKINGKEYKKKTALIMDITHGLKMKYPTKKRGYEEKRL